MAGTPLTVSTAVASVLDDTTIAAMRTSLGLGTAATTASGAYEPALGNPPTNGFILASSTLGVRSWVEMSSGAGSGTVTSVSVTTANGVSGSVANATTTPAITITLGAITPTSVAASGTVTGSNLSGTNTGDQTTITGNAGTATALATPRNINGTAFDGTANITVTAAAETLTGTTLPALNGAALTSISAANLTGDIAAARIATALTTPGPIGATPNSGAFTTLSATGEISGGAGLTLGTPVLGAATNITYLRNGSYTTNNGIAFTSQDFGLRLDLGLSWFNSDPSGAIDLRLVRDAANTLAQRNSTNNQTFRVYGTYTNSSNGRWLAGTGAYSSSMPGIYADGNGTGAGPDLYLGAVGGGRIVADADLVFRQDNVKDFGAVGANRPKNGNFAGNITIGTTSGYYWSGRSSVFSEADGNISFYNAAGTGFTRLQLGGTTSSFPSIKRNGVAINFRLADDSADAAITYAGGTSSDTLLFGAAGVQGQITWGSSPVNPSFVVQAKSGRALSLGANAGNHILIQNSGGVSIGTTTDPGASNLIVSGTIKPGSYTVATLPAGTVGMHAYVTDATAPTYLGALVGGGAVTCPVFYNGSAWVSH